MSRGVSDKITYKPYNQGGQWLLPPSLDELVPQNHFARIVSKTVDELEIEEAFARNTKGGGASRYNPVMLYRKTVTKKNKSGYLQTYEVYQCENCEGCPFRELCTKSEYGRVIQRNGHWLEQKAKVKDLLSSEEYKTLMKKRSTECETVFGQTKGNLGFRRFHLRGKEKVGIEWGLLMLGYDFKQLIRLMNT